MTDKFEQDGIETPQSTTGDETKARKTQLGKRRKLVIVLSVIAVVIVAAGVSAWIWHEQPSFCGTVCHDTMGSYLASYESGELLAHAHAEKRVVCLNCHDAELSTQLAELQVQLSGDYRLPLKKMNTDDGFCLREECHTREEIVEALDDYVAGDNTEVNPHAITYSADYSSTESPHEVGGTTIPCADCHAVHRRSEGINYCYDSCHHTKTFQTCYSCHDHR